MVESSSKKSISKKSQDVKEKPAKKAETKKKESSSRQRKQSKTDARLVEDASIEEHDEKGQGKSLRAEDEVVTYDEIDFELREITQEGSKVLIGPPRLTRFERARITGARSLQLSLGAPSLISVTEDIGDSISLATAELDVKALPISIRRILPNGVYQDIPIDWMK